MKSSRVQTISNIGLSENGVPAESDGLTAAFAPSRLLLWREAVYCLLHFQIDPHDPNLWSLVFLEAIDIAKPKSDIETLWETSGFLRQYPFEGINWVCLTMAHTLHHYPSWLFHQENYDHWIWGCQISDRPN